jgi:HEAT repeat protein
MAAHTGPDERSTFPTLTVVACLSVGAIAAMVLVSPPVQQRRAIASWCIELRDPATKGREPYLRLLDAGADAVPALMNVAADPSDAGRGPAVELLGRIGDPRGLPVVLSCDDPALATTRIEGLGRLHGDEALAAVLLALRGDDMELKFPALRVLADWKEVSTERLLPDVEPYLHHELFGLREFAVKFMGARRHAPAMGTLIGLLRDPEPAVRQMSAWSLLQIGDSFGIASVDSAIASGAVEPEED